MENKHAEISLGGKVCFSEDFQEDFGDIAALILSFERTGSVDFVRLYDENQEVVFEDSFD